MHRRFSGTEADQHAASRLTNRINRLATNRRSILGADDTVRVTIWYFDGSWLATCIYDATGRPEEVTAGQMLQAFSSTLVTEAAGEVV